jgi:hypothetical protein
LSPIWNTPAKIERHNIKRRRPFAIVSLLPSLLYSTLLYSTLLYCAVSLPIPSVFPMVRYIVDGAVDARALLLAKKRNSITDARDRLGQMAKTTDARKKIEKIRNIKQGKVGSERRIINLLRRFEE